MSWGWGFGGWDHFINNHRCPISVPLHVYIIDTVLYHSGQLSNLDKILLLMKWQRSLYNSRFIPLIISIGLN